MDKAYKNWHKNVVFKSKRVLNPGSLEELQRIVKYNRHVKPQGTTHCQTNIADSTRDGILVRLVKFKQITVNQDDTVSFGAGVSFGELIKPLELRGKALPVAPSYQGLNVVGTVITASYGQSTKEQIFAAGVVHFDMVMADGSVKSFFKGQDEDFYGVLMSFGRLGIITTMTMKVIPKYHVVRHLEYEVRWAGNYPSLLKSYDFVEAFANWKGEFMLQVFLGKKCEQDHQFTQTEAELRNEEIRIQNKEGFHAAKIFVQKGVGAWPNKIFLIHPSVKLDEPKKKSGLQSSFFIPADRFEEVMKEMLDLSPHFTKLSPQALCRPIPLDEIPFSPARGRDVINIHLNWGGEEEGALQVLEKIDDLMFRYKCKPHTGMMMSMPPDRVRELFKEDIQNLRTLVEKYDPEGKFANEFSVKYLGDEKQLIDPRIQSRFKLLLVAADEKEAEEGAAFFSPDQFQIKKICPENRIFPRTFDGIVIYFGSVEGNSDAEIGEAIEAKISGSLVTFMKRYSKSEPKVLFGNMKGPLRRFPHFKMFDSTEVSDCSQYLRENGKIQDELIQKIFSEFDKTQEAIAEPMEIFKAFSQTNIGLTHIDLEAMIKDIDVNTDGLLSLKEFRKWWMQGFLGISTQMKAFVALKLYEWQLLDKMKPDLANYMKRFIGEVDNQIKSNFQLNFNEGFKTKTQLYAKVFFCSQLIQEELEMLSGMHQFGDEDLDFYGKMDGDELPFILNVQVRTKKLSAVDSLITLQQMIREAGLEKANRKISLAVDGHKINVAVKTRHKSEFLKPFWPIFEALQKRVTVEQSVEILLKIGTSPQEMLHKDSPSIFESAMKGFTLQLKTNVWEEFAKRYADIIQEASASNEELKELGEQLLAKFSKFIVASQLRLNGKLNIKLPQEGIDSIAYNVLFEPLMVNVFDVVTMMTQNYLESQEEVYRLLADKAKPELVEIIKFIVENLGDDIEFAIGNKYLFVKGLLTTEGLGEVLKMSTRAAVKERKREWL